MIDFTTSVNSKNDGILQSFFSGSLSNGFYTVNSGSGRISTKYRGKIELEVAPMFSGSCGVITKLSGTDTDEKNITSKTTINVDRRELQLENGRYYMDFSVSNLIILNAKLLNSEPVIKYPSSLLNSYVIDWGNLTISHSGNISIGGYSSNFDSESGYHKLNTSSCSPTMWNNAHASDISVVFDAESAALLKVRMPELNNESGEMFFSGINRLFSKLSRNSAYKFSSWEPYSSTYNNKVSIIRTIFSKPYNVVLRNGEYASGRKFQGDNDTPTEAVARVTAAACSKLKEDYGNDLRIYILKYRPQRRYNLFPIYAQSQESAIFDYSVADGCATSPEYIYEIEDNEDCQENLKEKLDEIAEDIKNFAEYEPAKLVE